MPTPGDELVCGWRNRPVVQLRAKILTMHKRVVTGSTFDPLSRRPTFECEPVQPHDFFPSQFVGGTSAHWRRPATSRQKRVCEYLRKRSIQTRPAEGNAIG